jgi:hypothetical protein
MPAANENEFEMLDVVLELFFAAEYIVNGGSTKSAQKSEEFSDLKCLSLDDQSQISLAMKGVQIVFQSFLLCFGIDLRHFNFFKGKSEVVLKNFLKIVKLAFSYEAWDVFRRLSIKTLNYFQVNQFVSIKFNTVILSTLINLTSYLVLSGVSQALYKRPAYYSASSINGQILHSSQKTQTTTK